VNDRFVGVRQAAVVSGVGGQISRCVMSTHLKSRRRRSVDLARFRDRF
jgi:hypothetical protein